MAIYKKPDNEERLDKTSLPGSGRGRPLRSKNVSVIGSTGGLKRKLPAAEGLIIEGHLECMSAHHNKHLTVGEHGRVKADIHASTVTVLGQLIGDIYSEGMVSLAKGSDVKGNIFCASIAMETGARFTGKIDMGEPSKVPAKSKDLCRSKPFAR